MSYAGYFLPETPRKSFSTGTGVYTSVRFSCAFFGVYECNRDVQLLVFGFAARTTRVGVMNRKFGNQHVTWFHPRLRRISAYSEVCRMSASTNCPPGLRTRWISLMAFSRPTASYMLWIAKLDKTTSNDFSRKGNSRASESLNSTRSATPSRRAFSRVAWELLFA